MSILRTSLLLSIFSGAGSVVSFCSQLAIAYRFGAGQGLDAYLMAASVPAACSGVVASVLSYALIPSLVERVQSDKSFRETTGKGFSVVCVSVALAVVIGWATAPMLIAFFHSVPPAWQGPAIDMLRVCWMWAGALVIATYAGCVLIARKMFFRPALTASFPYVGVLVVLFAFPEAGLMGVPSGVLLGWIAASLVLMWGAWRHIEVRPLSVTKEDLRRGVKTFGTVAAAMSCFSVVGVVDAYWAPSLGEDQLSYLGYGQRIIVAIGSLVIAGPAVVLVPHLADVASGGGNTAVRRRLVEVAQLTSLCGAAFGITMAAMAEPAIRLIFERGEFTARDTANLSALLPWLLVGMAGMLGVVVLFRGLFQLHMGAHAAFVSLIWCVLYWGFSGLFSTPYGAVGIAAAYALAWWVAYGAAISVITGRPSPRALAKCILFVTACGAASACSYFAVSAMLTWLNTRVAMGLIAGLGALAGTGLIGVCAFTAVAWLITRLPAMASFRGRA